MTLDAATLGWEVERPSGLAFATAAAPTVWRVDVTGPPATWEAQLALRRREVERAAERQVQAGRRLVELVGRPEGLAFGAGPASGPEAELAGLLGTSASGPGLSFGVLDGLADRWSSVVERFQAAIDRIGRLLRQLGVVETAVDGTPIARSLVGLDSDLRTVWRHGPTEATVALHAGAVATALAARREVARGLRLLFEGAVLIATLPALVTNPAGLLVALPAIWRFIERVMSEPDAP